VTSGAQPVSRCEEETNKRRKGRSRVHVANMFPFSDVGRGHVIQTARAFEEFESTVAHCIDLGIYTAAVGGDEETGLAESDMSYFYVLARSLEMIASIEEINFKHGVFYDLSGSCGRLGLGAALLEHFAKVECLEGTKEHGEEAEHLMKEFLLRGTHDRDFDYMVNTKSFMSHKWADADLVFFDSTLFNTYIDEGTLVDELQKQAEGCAAGTYIILLTTWKKNLLNEDFKVVTIDRNRRIDTEKTVNVWIYRKVSAAVDYKKLKEMERLLKEDEERGTHAHVDQRTSDKLLVDGIGLPPANLKSPSHDFTVGTPMTPSHFFGGGGDSPQVSPTPKSKAMGAFFGL